MGFEEGRDGTVVVAAGGRGGTWGGERRGRRQGCAKFYGRVQLSFARSVAAIGAGKGK